MTHDELINLLRSDNPDKVKRALQYIEMLIGKGEKITDEILILMLQSNLEIVCNTALEYLIRRKQKIVLSKMPIPPQLEKDDIFIDACFQLWRYVRKKGFDTSKEGAIERFLYAVCKKYIYKCLDRNPHYDDIDTNVIKTIESSENPLPKIYKDDTRTLLGGLFKSLGKECKEILELKYWEGKTYKQIAKDLNRNEGNVKVSASRCMRKLRKWIDDNPDLGDFIKDLLND